MLLAELYFFNYSSQHKDQIGFEVFCFDALSITELLVFANFEVLVFLIKVNSKF